MANSTIFNPRISCLWLRKVVYIGDFHSTCRASTAPPDSCQQWYKVTSSHHTELQQEISFYYSICANCTSPFKPHHGSSSSSSQKPRARPREIGWRMKRNQPKKACLWCWPWKYHISLADSPISQILFAFAQQHIEHHILYTKDRLVRDSTGFYKVSISKYFFAWAQIL